MGRCQFVFPGFGGNERPISFAGRRYSVDMNLAAAFCAAAVFLLWWLLVCLVGCGFLVLVRLMDVVGW